MPNQILSLRDSLITGVSAGFAAFMQFIPSLLGAIIVLAIGWFVSKLVARILERVLHSLRFDHLASRVGIAGPLQKSFGPSFTMTHVFGVLTKWFVMLVFIQAAANILAMPQVTEILNSVVLFIPRLFVAILILALGAWGAQIVGRLVEGAVSRTSFARPGVFSLIARYSVLGFAGVAAIHQLGIATNLINILFTGLVGSIALALGIAFGLGGQSVAHDLTRNWYDRGKDAQSRLKSVTPPQTAQRK